MVRPWRCRSRLPGFAPVEEVEPLAAGPVVPETPAAEAPSVPQRRPPRRAAAPPKTNQSPRLSLLNPRRNRSVSCGLQLRLRMLKQIERSALLLTASRNLGNVDYQKLSLAGKEQYQQAKDFSEQAGEALTQRNYVFAETLADKAAKLASELLGR